LLLNDVVDGKSAGDIGLDIAKAYVHEAAGGDASPAAQFTDTFFNDLEQGKSPREIAMDMVHKSRRMIERIEPDLPVVSTRFLGTSDVPAANMPRRSWTSSPSGRALSRRRAYWTEQAAGDALTKAGSGDAFKDTGLDRLAPYAETAGDDFLHGKSFEQIAEHVGRQVLATPLTKAASPRRQPVAALRKALAIFPMAESPTRSLAISVSRFPWGNSPGLGRAQSAAAAADAGS